MAGSSTSENHQSSAERVKHGVDDVVGFASGNTDVISREDEARYLSTTDDTTANPAHQRSFGDDVDAALLMQAAVSNTTPQGEGLSSRVCGCTVPGSDCQRPECGHRRRQDTLPPNQTWDEAEAQGGEPLHAWAYQKLSDKHNSLANMECAFRSGGLARAGDNEVVQDCNTIVGSGVSDETFPTSAAAMTGRRSGSSNRVHNNAHRDNRVASDLFSDQYTSSSLSSSKPVSRTSK